MTLQEIAGGFLVPVDDCLGKWIIESQRLDHDQHLVPLVCSHLKEGDVVIDCGCYVGDHTIAYSLKVGKEGCVIAIEAGKDAFECLVHNAKLFLNKNVVCIKCALGKDDYSKVYHHKVEDNLGMSVCSTVESDDAVVVQTLDTICLSKHNSIQKLDFIKIDCEGFECDILEGAEKLLEKFRPKMLIEVNSHKLSEHGSSRKKLYDLLKTYKYQTTIVQPQCSFEDPQYDILCTPL